VAAPGFIFQMFGERLSMFSLEGCYVVQNASSQTMPVFVRQT